MNPDEYGIQMDAKLVDKDIDELNADEMSEEDVDKYIEENFGYIEHPEVK